MRYRKIGTALPLFSRLTSCRDTPKSHRAARECGDERQTTTCRMFALPKAIFRQPRQVHFLSQSRRKFLTSLGRSALVLPFTDVLALARPVSAPEQTQPEPKADAAKDIGVTFVDVARESGLNAKTIFGGEHKNKY